MPRGTGWTATVTSVAYLQANNSYAGSCPGADRGAQQITLQVSSPHSAHGAVETLVIVKRNL